MPEDAIKGLEGLGKKYINKEFSQMVFKQIDCHVKNFFIFCEGIREKDLSKLSNLKLKQIVKKYENFVRLGLLYFAVSSSFSTHTIEERIKEILRKKIKDKSILEDFFISLMTPEEMDETMKERIDFLELMKRKYSEVDLIEYSRKYPALFVNTYDFKEIMEFLKNKIEDKKSDKEIDLEIRRIKENLDSISKKHQEIYNLFKSDELEQLARRLQRVALDRYRLKHVWNGAEYMCLHLLEDLAKRVDMDLKEFMKVYTFKDIYNLLDNKTKLTKKQIEDHKKCLIFHNINGKLYRYSGEEGQKYIEKLLKFDEEELDKEIKGTVANMGKVKGKVKIVNVRDLKQFIKDTKKFKKGEILVTTMTSPIMVPIIEKAGAIVTVEGGICSHAAVISREFKIPCIVGADNATKILKDGDYVEVDANKGVVMVIKNV
ncbi:hypothetical protein CEE44_04700 [Candidatus Woesearchaeota archaeon B3_Woes]|nr:MAG: hypothetical protein CEE44_04700 [Candidatus Woesearchaeota archaeon B3_Woes]